MVKYLKLARDEDVEERLRASSLKGQQATERT
jgi:hypothetical protein